MKYRPQTWQNIRPAKSHNTPRRATRRRSNGGNGVVEGIHGDDGLGTGKAADQWSVANNAICNCYPRSCVGTSGRDCTVTYVYDLSTITCELLH